MADVHDNLTEVDDLRPQKKMKVDGASPRSVGSGESDWDALYGVQKERNGVKSQVAGTQNEDHVETIQNTSSLPASEMKASEAQLADPTHSKGTFPLEPLVGGHGNGNVTSTVRTEDGSPTVMVDDEGDELVGAIDSKLASSDAASTHMNMATAEIATQPERDQLLELERIAQDAVLNEPGSGVVLYTDESMAIDPTGETAPDSDPEDSSDDSSSDSDDSDTASMVMDPAELTAMLERGDAEDDADRGAGGPPRTVHELKEEIPAKPNITITASTPVTLLGTVMHFAENRLVITGDPGMTFEKVPAIDSALCNADREIIGAISDVMGTTSNPFFLVILAESELAALKLQQGVKVFYVNEYSKFDSVDEIRAKKHTDASNLHDEEVGEDEEEFSDDEKEAEYKKLNKQSKRGGQGKLSRTEYLNNDRSGQYDQFREDRGGRGRGRGRGGRGDRARGRGGRGGRGGYGDDDGYPRNFGNYHGDNMPDVRVELTYGDDDRPADGAVSPLGADGYIPLKRPDNLSQLMRTGAPSTNADRGGQRSGGQDRGRGRGGNDRGRGGSNSNYRGDRGAPYVPHPLPQMPPAPQPQQQQAYSGYAPASANGYSPNSATNNTQPYQQPQYNTPATAASAYQQPAQTPAWPSWYQPNTATPAQQAYGSQVQQSYSAQPQQRQGQYQFQGQTYQYPPAAGYTQPQPQTQTQQVQQIYMQPPGGAYNPNFAAPQWNQQQGGQGQQGQQGQRR